MKLYCTHSLRYLTSPLSPDISLVHFLKGHRYSFYLASGRNKGQYLVLTTKTLRKDKFKISEKFSKYELFIDKINYRLSSLLISCWIKRITEMAKKISPHDFISFIARLFWRKWSRGQPCQLHVSLHLCWWRMSATSGYHVWVIDTRFLWFCF